MSLVCSLTIGGWPMRLVSAFVGLVVFAVSATGAFAQDYRRQLQSMNYHDLMAMDVNTLDSRQARTLNDVRADRERAVTRAFERTQTVRDEFTARSTVVSPDGFVLTEQNCASREDCTIILRREIRNQCGQRGYGLNAEYEFCNFRSAFARGGVELVVSRQDFDIDSRTSTRLVGMPASCSTCRSTQRRVTDVHNTYKETYLVEIPLEYLRTVSASGDLAIQFSSVRENYVLNIDQEAIIGFLRAADAALTERNP